MQINSQLSIFDELSESYYNYVSRFITSDFEHLKVLGKFYTHRQVSKRMSNELISIINNLLDYEIITIIDPFCGDGRLICDFITAISEIITNDFPRIEVTIWDIEEEAVECAKNNISKIAKEYSLDVNIHAESKDSFLEYYHHIGQFDICITNPPWSIVKPQKIFNGSRSKVELNEYKLIIQEYDSRLKEIFELSLPSKKFGKWGTNLARCGVEVAHRLIKKGGYGAFVSPASLFNDQVSIKLRAWLFNNSDFRYIDYYVPEAKLYSIADIASVTAVFKVDKSNSIIIHNRIDKSLSLETTTIDKDMLDFIKANDYILPFDIGIENIRLLEKFDSLETLNDYTQKWGVKICREIDETRISEKFIENGEYVFLKGKMINRFSYNIEPVNYINTEKYKITGSSELEKIVWRDVARVSKKRRIKATIVPKKTVAGNSLHVLYLTTEDSRKLKTLLAVINSLVFEFIAKSKLVSNHVSKGVIQFTKVPNMSNINDELVSKVEMCLLDNDFIKNEIDIECIIASMYNITYREFIKIVGTFDLEANFKQQLINRASEILV